MTSLSFVGLVWPHPHTNQPTKILPVILFSCLDWFARQYVWRNTFVFLYCSCLFLFSDACIFFLRLHTSRRLLFPSVAMGNFPIPKLWSLVQLWRIQMRVFTLHVHPPLSTSKHYSCNATNTRICARTPSKSVQRLASGRTQLYVSLCHFFFFFFFCHSHLLE